VNARVLAELEALKKKKGILRAEDVVDFARDETTALHEQFEWDDGAAAEAYRIEQARRIIRVTVTVIRHEEKDYRVRTFVSLTPDRKLEKGGYRATYDVMGDAEHRAQLLADALAELQTFRKKYAILKELSGVFEEIEKLKARKAKTA